VIAVAPRDERSLLLLRNTLLLAAGVCAIALPVGVGIAWLLLRTDAPGRRSVLAALAVLLFLPVYLQAAGWSAGLGVQGWLTWNQDGWSTPVLEGWNAAIWIHAMAALPWVVLIVGLGLRHVDHAAEQAAVIDGSLAHVFVRISLPQLLPAILAAGLWVSVTTAGEIAVTDLYQVRTYAEEVYTLVPLLDLSQLEAGQPAVKIPPGTAILALFAAAALVAIAKIAPHSSLFQTAHRVRFRLRRWRWPAAAVILIVACVAVGVPVINLIFQSGIVVQRDGESWLRSWSLTKSLSSIATATWQFREELGWSLLIALVASTIAVSVAAPAAWWARQRPAGRVTVVAAIALLLAIPGPVLGLRLIWLLNRGDVPFLLWLYDRTIVPPVLAQAARGLPLATLVCWYAFASISNHVVESSMLDGASGWSRFTRVGLPQRKLALAGAWLVALTLSLGELSASMRVIPPGITTVPVRVFGLLHAGVDDQVAALCLNMALSLVLVAFVAILMLRRGLTVDDGHRTSEV
jgi:iron(III) transport system permease protein